MTRQAIVLGATVMAATVLPLMLGLWLDQRYQTTPWLTVVGLVTGTILASVGVLLITRARFHAVEQAYGRRKRTTSQQASTPQPPKIDDEQEDKPSW